MTFAFGPNSPCGACKFLRRKCKSDCIFAPYFCSEQDPAKFVAIHKVFGASNISKLLSNIPAHARHEAAITIAYEAQARLRDPVYGCVVHIFALQQQVAYLQAQVMQEKAQLLASGIVNNGSLYGPSCSNSISPESSLEFIDGINDDDLAFMLEDDMGELQGLEFQMMGN